MTARASSASGIDRRLDAEQRAQLGPADHPVTGHQHEDEVAVAAPDDHGLDDVGRLHAAGHGGLSETAHRPVTDDAVSQPQLLSGRRTRRLVVGRHSDAGTTSATRRANESMSSSVVSHEHIQRTSLRASSHA